MELKTHKRIHFGVIGAGHRASAHIGAMQRLGDDIEIAAICDSRQKQLNDAGRSLGRSVAQYTDWTKLLANPDIDAVLIATPNCTHREMLLAALAAGKHVVCEKPMAVNYDECTAMKSAIEARPDRVVLFAMQLRYSPRLQIMRQLIEEGKIGRPGHLLFVEFRGDWINDDVWEYDDPRLGKINWRYSRASAGGTLSEKACHHFDILNWMVGATPETISCAGGIGRYQDGRDMWDHATTTITYPGGAIAIHDLCMFGPDRFDLQVIGDEASLLLNDDGLYLERGHDKKPVALPPEVLHGAPGDESAMARMYQDFIDCIRSNTKPWMDVAKAMASCKTAWLGELSSNQKRAVKWEELA